MSRGAAARDVKKEMNQEEYQPWFLDVDKDHPFKFSRKLHLKRPSNSDLRALAFFPWDYDSLEKLWQGSLHTTDNQARWKDLVSKYWDAIAVTSDDMLTILFTHQKRKPLSVKLPKEPLSDPNLPKMLDSDRMCISWAMNHKEISEPLVLFSRRSILYSYNIERLGIQAYIRGHGGTITSISTHPTNIHLICTTSRDYSTRIYDLTLDATLEAPSAQLTKKKLDLLVPNPTWPPVTGPSLGGAAHGLRLSYSEKEGVGLGRCVSVLMGGRSGGHTAAVLSAAFHPTFPLLATCGVDRTVKIWLVRPNSTTTIKREDKPLFSSSRIHKARVLSISWLDDDTLLTHSAPAIMHVDPTDHNNKGTHVEPGELTIWRWLGLNRFFPANHEVSPSIHLHGISSDYQESSSFKILSTHSFPATASQLHAPTLSLYHNATHDPVMAITYSRSTTITLVNAAHMLPRPPPAFPTWVAETLLSYPVPPGVVRAEKEQMEKIDARRKERAAALRVQAELNAAAVAMMRMHLSEGNTGDTDSGIYDDTDTEAEAEEDIGNRDEDPDEVEEDTRVGEADEDEDEGLTQYDEIDKRRMLRIAVPTPPVLGWKISVNEEADEGQRVMACGMGAAGQIVAAAGTNGCVWVWKIQM